MIAILLNDNSFEQDIRELLMAFYPGSSFTHEEDENADVVVKGEREGDYFSLSLAKKGDQEKQLHKESVKVDFSNRFDAKCTIKQMLYRLAGAAKQKELPWGTLTGIRPTKIAMTKFAEGFDESQVHEYMKKTYFTSDEKIGLAMEVAQREEELLKTIDYENGYSLYIGIPFCPTTCLYCSFTSFPIGLWKGKTHLYLEALFKEIGYVADRMKDKTLDTVYIGGGTPTALSAEELDQILCKVEGSFNMQSVKEFTVEAGRPDSITEEKLETLKKHGISRISINPQTMKQETLDLIGRLHSVELVKEKYHLARKMGFDNINMDLIVGLPGETMDDVKQTMEQIKELAPDGITVHSLAIKRAARLNMQKEQYSDLKMINTQEMIDMTARYAKDMGMNPYYLYRQKNMAGNFENVGYATPGTECIYNILIMEEKQTIMACGAGTTTKVLYPSENRLERAENVKDVAQYIDRVEEMFERKERLIAPHK